MLQSLQNVANVAVLSNVANIAKTLSMFQMLWRPYKNVANVAVPSKCCKCWRALDNVANVAEPSKCCECCKTFKILQVLQSLLYVANGAELSKCCRDLNYGANVSGFPGLQEFFFALLHLCLQVINTICSLLCRLSICHFCIGHLRQQSLVLI